MKARVLFTVLSLFSLPGWTMPEAEAAERPNIVMILADDISAEDLGCYGNPGIKTPNLDQLAKTGIRFDNGFVVAASCAPSRGSIMTGRYPHATGMAALKALHRPDKAECWSVCGQPCSNGNPKPGIPLRTI